MNTDPEYHNYTNLSTGWVELICGCMFSGKTEELMRRLRRAKIAQQSVEIFKPTIDKRYHSENIVSHDENTIRSTPIQFPRDILMLAENSTIIGIDEAQFFDKDIIKVANLLANKGKRIIIAGLDMDFTGKPFSPVCELMSIAEFVTKMHAICMKCGNIASYSFRKSDTKEQVVIGDKDIYEARCRTCFIQEYAE